VLPRPAVSLLFPVPGGCGAAAVAYLHRCRRTQRVARLGWLGDDGPIPTGIDGGALGSLDSYFIQPPGDIYSGYDPTSGTAKVTFNADGTLSGFINLDNSLDTTSSTFSGGGAGTDWTATLGNDMGFYTYKIAGYWQAQGPLPPIDAVPEPASAVLLLGGIALLAVAGRYGAGALPAG
jgi:hypothetical protein